MPSPLPGMNPFLENPDVWSTFHIQMLAAMADRLSAQVRPDYLVHMEAHIERQRYLEIRDRRNRELVAVVELLSPVNKKSGPNRAQYLTKRSEILASPAHLVEIDLLRCGLAMPDHERPSSTYGVMVSRAEERPAADFWPIELRQPLPTIPVPLRQANSYASLELQELLHHVYDQGPYVEEIYEQEAEPPLDPADLGWAEHVLSQAKL
ncbi:MAG: DUF4058 family protein [Isosphaeraceae bacterium]